MSSSGSYSRDELSQAYAEAWRKRDQHRLLSPLEALLTDVIRLHPEYHALVGDADAARSYEHDAAYGTESPFLHMGLHMAVREQIAIDRPPGVRELHGLLQRHDGDPHGAEHVLMEALAETLWNAQASGNAPDEGAYLRRARRSLNPG